MLTTTLQHTVKRQCDWNFRYGFVWIENRMWHRQDIPLVIQWDDQDECSATCK